MSANDLHELFWQLQRPAEPLPRPRCHQWTSPPPPRYFDYKFHFVWGGYPAHEWWYILGSGMVPPR